MEKDTQGKVILVVNDDPGGRYVWIKDLATAGFEVVEAMHGEQALGTAARTTPEIAIVDVMLPGIDGFELCRRFKADPRTARIRVIHTSVRPDVEKLQELSRAAGGDAFLPQPFTKGDLASTLRAMLVA